MAKRAIKYAVSSLKSQFVSDTLLNFTLTGFSSVFNYACIILAGHFLSKPEFGTFNALLSVIILTTVLSMGIQLKITKQVSQSEEQNTNLYFSEILKPLIDKMLIMCLVFLFIYPFAAKILRATHLEISILYFCLLMLILSATGNGLTFGKMQIKTQATITLIAAFLRFVLTLLLFQIAVGVEQALWGYGIGFIIVFVLSFICTKTKLSLVEKAIKDRLANALRLIVHITNIFSAKTKSNSFVRSFKIGYLTLAFILLFAPFALDQILVQSLSPTNSGDYGAIITLGKLIFFAASPIIIAVFPYLTTSNHDNTRQKRYFLAAFALTILVATSFLTVIYLCRDFIIVNTFSSQYLLISPYIGFYGIAVVLFNCSYCLAHYYLAKADYSITPRLFTTLIFQILIFSLRHETLSDLVTNQLAVYSLQFILLLLHLPKLKSKKKTEKEQEESNYEVPCTPMCIGSAGIGQLTKNVGYIFIFSQISKFIFLGTSSPNP